MEIGVAVGGERAISAFAPLGDHLVGVEPDATLVAAWNAVDGVRRIGGGAPAIGQIPICWDPDKDVAVAKAHEQFRWFGGVWKVNADLPTPAGFTDVALVQIGDEGQDRFLQETAGPLLDSLRAAAP